MVWFDLSFYLIYKRERKLASLILLFDNERRGHEKPESTEPNDELLMITVEMLMLMIVMVMKTNRTNTEPDGHHDEDEADGDGSYGDGEEVYQQTREHRTRQPSRLRCLHPRLHPRLQPSSKHSRS